LPGISVDASIRTMPAAFTNGACRPAAVFATTHWSVVLDAAQETGESTNGALEVLCRAYWYPIYAYVRRLGHSPHDAQDLTQSFFAYVLEKRLIARAQPEAGRFRSFLLGSLRNFLANEWRRQTAQKRGGGQVIPIDARSAEERYAVEPMDKSNPQALYDEAWAAAVLDEAISLLEAEYHRTGKGTLFAELLPTLQGSERSGYAETAARLGLTEGAVKAAAHRLRTRYRELLRATVAHTVAEPAEVDEELRHLMHVLSGA
jgi:RNA polymerase sigma factor (sigma-70 family)